VKNRLGAALVAAASVATVVTVAAPAAQAAVPCGTYPPGQAYSLVRVPTSATVRKGAPVSTRGTLRRGGQACVDFNLGIYTKAANVGVYHLTRAARTDTTGSAHTGFIVNITTRFYYNVNLGNGASVHSSFSEMIAR
jgi:hypothetical protein